MILAVIAYTILMGYLGIMRFVSLWGKGDSRAEQFTLYFVIAPINRDVPLR